MLAFLLLLCACATASAQELPPPIAAIEDPRSLEWLAESALSGGQQEDARMLFRAMLERQEIRRYLGYREILEEALILERLGKHDEAADTYRASMKDDVLRTVQVLRIMSVHPDREALVQEAYAHVRDVVDRAKRGEKAVIYVTSKGDDRYLKVMTTKEVMDQARKGEQSRYCYIEDFDLTDYEEIPEVINLVRCVVGQILIPDKDVHKLFVKGFVLGDVDIGKTWEGEANKSRTLRPSRVDDLVFRDAVILGRANFSDVEIPVGRAYFPMAVFEGPADFKGAEFHGWTEFRFASFGADANFKDLRIHGPVYFGGARFREDTVFTGVESDQDLFFNSVTFERGAAFERCEWHRMATFEDARFFGPTNFSRTQVDERLNLSRAVFSDHLLLAEVQLGALDAFGTWFQSEAQFADSAIEGRTRFALDAVTRDRHEGDVDGLLPFYRDYQGDEDAEEPLTTTSSYGVKTLEHLTAQIGTDIAFSNVRFGGLTVFEGVRFGVPDTQSVASFYNAQFIGETHFERTEWNSLADFTTIFGYEVAFNEARFNDSLILDDAYVAGRLSMTDATFDPQATFSFYAAEIRSFQLDGDHTDRGNGEHRLFYEACAEREIDLDDPRLKRWARGFERTESEIRQVCYDRLLDEWVALKEAYGNEAMIVEEDNAYWWLRHHETMAKLKYGTLLDRVTAVVVDLFIFEICFGWGVDLGNLGIAVLVVTVLFAMIYRVFCPDSVLIYDGGEMKIRDVSFVGMVFVSLQSLLAINTGWDFAEDDHKFRYLNTIETAIGVIILTFFVGAYTRMILA